MVNYRHLYHAGNFADVFKHCILVMLMRQLCKKDKPILYLDTHCGIGKYDLTSTIAQKTREFTSGIARIYKVREAPRAVLDYLEIIRSKNADSDKFNFPKLYPGSASFIQALLRGQDRMILVELHSEDVKTLKREFMTDKRVAVHQADGYQSIKAFLPPKKGRGLILIDPPFEDKNEFASILTALRVAWQRFPIGVYAIWYPIKDLIAVEHFQEQVQEVGFKEILFLKISVDHDGQVPGLTSCGMVIINPPWKIESELQSMIEWLTRSLRGLT